MVRDWRYRVFGLIQLTPLLRGPAELVVEGGDVAADGVGGGELLVGVQEGVVGGVCAVELSGVLVAVGLEAP